MQALLDLIRGRRVLPVAPTTFVAQLPELDADGWDDETEFEPDLESIAGVGCVMTYSDSRGAESIRRVTCRKLSSRDSTLYLQAFCHEREALRTFRTDRVVEVVCGVTGEIFSPADFFARYTVAEDGGAAVGWGLDVQSAADLRAGLNVLAFLARCDGRVVAEEQDIIRQFCQSFSVRFAADQFDYDGACRHACRLAPDAETFYVSLARLKRDGAPLGLSRLARQSAGRLIAADGTQDEREFYFGVKVEEYLAD